jgi:hypothetical protein
VLLWALGGACELRHVWSVVCDVADAVLTKEYARLKLCRCDV